MSLPHTRLGALGWKFRLSKLGAIVQTMLAVDGYDEFTLSACFDVVLLYEPPNSFFPNSHTIDPKFPPNPWPAIFTFAFCMHSLDANQQCGVANALAGNRRIICSFSSLMPKVTASTDIERFASPANWPAAFVPFNPGVLHSDSHAKHAVAFLRMSRSIFTLASSAFSRVNSICSALIGLAPASPIGLLLLAEPSSLMSDWASPDFGCRRVGLTTLNQFVPLPICIPVYTMLA